MEALMFYRLVIISLSLFVIGCSVAVSTVPPDTMGKPRPLYPPDAPDWVKGRIPRVITHNNENYIVAMGYGQSVSYKKAIAKAQLVAKRNLISYIGGIARARAKRYAYRYGKQYHKVYSDLYREVVDDLRLYGVTQLAQYIAQTEYGIYRAWVLLGWHKKYFDKALEAMRKKTQDHQQASHISTPPQYSDEDLYPPYPEDENNPNVSVNFRVNIVPNLNIDLGDIKIKLNKSGLSFKCDKCLK